MKETIKKKVIFVSQQPISQCPFLCIEPYLLVIMPI